MNRDQLISSGQALLDLDARGALVPHGIGGHARSIIEGFIALERPPAPDQTNAEVSDERLRETEETRKLLDEAADFSERMTSQPWACELVERLADALNRRSVTSQASEGAVVAWHSRETPTPLDQWIWVSDGVVTWILRGDGKPFDERATACKYWALAGVPFRLPNGEIVTVFEDEPADSVSKRVERLETLLTQALHVLDQPEIYTIWPVSALRMEVTQALGGRS